MKGFSVKPFAILFLILMTIYNAQADYYSAKTKDKDLHLWLDNYEAEGYLYYKSEAEVYKLARNISESKKQTSYEFKIIKEKTNEDVGKLELKKKGQELLGNAKFLDQKKLENLTFLPRKQSDIIPFETTDIQAENDKCVLEILDLRSIRNEKVVNRILLMNQKVMSYFSEFGCEYLTQKEVLEKKEVDKKVGDSKITNETIKEFSDKSGDKAQLACKSEVFLFKNRFFGINYYCQAVKKSTVKKKNFYQLYDTQLNIEVKKEDFTDSDVIGEDDNLGIMFGLSPVGLFLYYSDDAGKFETYQNHIPFYNLQKSFEKWGKSKRYLRYFELK